MSKLVIAVGGISAGAVRAAGEPGSSPPHAGLHAVHGLMRLVAETIAAPIHQAAADVEQIRAFLAQLVCRYGTLKRSVEAIASGKRKHPLISQDRARAWHQTLSAIPTVAEQTLAHHATLSVGVNKWIAAQGDGLEARLDDYVNWLDGQLTENVGGTAAEGSAPAAQPFDALTPDQERDIEMVRAVWLDDKRPGETIAGIRPPTGANTAIERLSACAHPLATAVVALAKNDFPAADAALVRLDGMLDPADAMTLQADRLYFEKLYDDAAPIYRQARTRRDDFRSRRNLAACLLRCQRGSVDAHSKEAIDLLTDTVRSMKIGTPAWVRGRILLGMAWMHLHAGERDANLRHAIECFESAAQTISRDDEPEWWAETHLHLGSAWQALPSGKHLENLQRAMTCFNRAAEVWTRETHPDQWAVIQNNLGHAWEKLPSGIRAVNVQRAIEFFNAALSVRTREAHPSSWAQLQNNLGNAWIQCPSESPEQHKANIEKAIACHSAALEVWSQQQRRSEWAATQNNLGNAWALMPAENDEREKNLRRAIACYKGALDVRTRSTVPAEWASTQNNLGNALLALPNVPNSRHIDEAIECFTKALDVRTRAAFPVDWAKTRANLGHAYALLNDEEDRRENLQEAAQCYTGALEVLTDAAFPHQHAHVRSRLEEVRTELKSLR